MQPASLEAVTFLKSNKSKADEAWSYEVMKIAIFTNNYLPNVYGVPMSVETFRKEFEALGHEVFVFAPNYPGYHDDNKNVFRYPSLDINIRFRLPLGIPYSWRMEKILEKLDLDIIHSQHPNLLGSAALKWAKKKNIPIIFTWHTLYDQYTNFVPFVPQKFAADWIIKKAVKYANRVDAVIVPTPSVVPVIDKWGVKNEIFSIATGVVEKEFENPDGRAIRKKYGIEDDDILLLVVSRITDEKNIEFVFESMAVIASKKENVKGMLVGDGYLLPKLKNIAKEKKLENKIIFTGLVSGRNDIKNYYAAGDIFVYASKSETQGMIMTEAMCMGLPIVAVKASGAKDIVRDGQTGFLTRENQEEFSGAIMKLEEDSELRKKFGENAKKFAREEYSSRACAKKALEVYGRVIEKSRSRNKRG